MKQIVSFEESKKLKESGALIRAVFRYDKNGQQSLALADPTEYHLADEYYPSPMTGELIEWICNSSTWMLEMVECGAGWEVYLEKDCTYIHEVENPELIDGLVELALKIKEKHETDNT